MFTPLRTVLGPARRWPRGCVMFLSAMGACWGAAPGSRAQCVTNWTEGSNAPGIAGANIALQVFDDHRGGGPALYVAGVFDSVAGAAVHNIVRYDGVTFAPLGSGLVDSFGCSGAYSMAVYDDGSGAGPALYVGGCISSAGGVPVSLIAKWDGEHWSDVGGGAGTPNPNVPNVQGMTVFDDGSGPALYVCGYFTTAGSSALPVHHVAKWDGHQWSAVGSLPSTAYSLAVFDDDGAGPHPPALYCSNATGVARWNGTQWVSVGVPNGDVSTMVVFDDDGPGPRLPALYVGGRFTSIGGVGANRVAKYDGSTWSAVGPGFNGCYGLGCQSQVASLTVADDGSGPALFAGGTFTMSGANTINHVAKWTGAVWIGLGGGIPVSSAASVFDTSVRAMAPFDRGDGARLYVAGSFPIAGNAAAAGIAAWDGTGWSALLPGVEFDSPPRPAVVFTDAAGPALYMGGAFQVAGDALANGIVRYDGHTWSALGEGVSGCSGQDCPSLVAALAVFDDGAGADLYAGGLFSDAGGLPANNIARWDGATWSTLGTGLNGRVTALQVFDDDGAGPDQPALYAGGSFTGAGGVVAPYVAKWDGQAWSAVGGGAPGPVIALGIYNSQLYALGRFPGTPPDTNCLARLNPGAWEVIPSRVRVGDNVQTMAVYTIGSAPGIYVAGRMQSLGGVNLSNFARWNGANWSAVGSGISGVPQTLLLRTMTLPGVGTHLYLCGDFTSVAGVGAAHIARWDGVQWSGLGAGTNGTVTAMGAFDDGGGAGTVLHIAGSFTQAGLGATNQFARYAAEPARVIRQPSSDTSRTHGVGRFNALGAGTGPINYQWRHDGAPLNDDGRIFGSRTPALVIADLTSADAGHYALTVSNQCGMATSDDAILTIACPADWDQSGAANSADFFAFLNDFFGGAADFNGDGVTSSQDYFDFLTAYFAGC